MTAVRVPNSADLLTMCGGSLSATAALAADDSRADDSGRSHPGDGHEGPTDASCATHHHEKSVGGQAVIEGVMMRGRRSWGLAVRLQDGTIARHSFTLDPLGERYPVLKWPLLRGIVTLGESLVLGMRALGLSANLSLEGEPAATERATDGASGDIPGAIPGDTPDGAQGDTPQGASHGASDGASVPRPAVVATENSAESLGWKELAVTFAIAMALAIVLFVVIPLAVVKYFEHIFSNPFVFNLVEGIIRIAIFLAYVSAISLIPDLRRVFEYHGAEHKVIHAYEAGEELDPANAERFTTLHPRCGTAFLFMVMVIAILVFSIVGKPSLLWLVVSRIVGIPIVAGLSYEVIRFAGRHKDGFVARVLLWPGLLLQRLTTREPSVEQVEVAIAALAEVLRVDEGGEPDSRSMVAAAG